MHSKNMRNMSQTLWYSAIGEKTQQGCAAKLSKSFDKVIVNIQLFYIAIFGMETFPDESLHTDTHGALTL